MKRLAVALINWILCVGTAIIIRCLIAVPHKMLIMHAAPVKLYNIWNVFPWHILFLMPMFVSCFYYKLMDRSNKGLTLGERLTGIRINTKWRIWHALAEGAAVIFYPVTIIFVCLTGRMPYDRILQVEVRNTRNDGDYQVKKGYCTLFVIIVILIISYSFSQLETRQKLRFLYYGTGTVAWLTNANLIMGLYTSCVEPPFEYLGERKLTETEMGEKEEEMFSEEGRKSGWAFVTSAMDYTEEGRKKLWAFATGDEHCEFYETEAAEIFDNNVIVVSYGRKLKNVRIIDELGLSLHTVYEPYAGFPFCYAYLELSKENEANTVYCYAVSEIVLYKWAKIQDLYSEDMIIEPSLIDWVCTDYELYKVIPESRRYSIIEQGGIFDRWKWLYQRLNDLLNPILKTIIESESI